MKSFPSHKDNLISLRRIEGQVRGIQRMIEEGEYCVDILTQIHAVISALARVEDKILQRHFEHCVTGALKNKSEAEVKRKTSEILKLISRFRKT